MGHMLDLQDDGVLWSFTTELDFVDFYVNPDYYAVPLDWTIDWGILGYGSTEPSTSIALSYASSHPNLFRDWWGSGYDFDLGEADIYTIPHLIYKSYNNLDSEPRIITGSALLKTNTGIPFTAIYLTLLLTKDYTPASYDLLIDWGDGTTTTDSPPSPPLWLDVGDTPETDYSYYHEYAEPGEYLITFTTTEDVYPDAEDYAEIWCHVTPAPAPFTYGCTVDWGDGTISSDSAVTDGRGLEEDEVAFSHSYDTPGPHTVKIIATEGRWVPSFPFGAYNAGLIELGPMRCGFRFGVDLSEYTFEEAGYDTLRYLRIDPGFKLDNAMFMEYTLYTTALRHSGENFPLAPIVPALAFPALRHGYDIYTGPEYWIPLYCYQSIYQCALYSQDDYQYIYFAGEDLWYYPFYAIDLDYAPDGLYDDLIDYVHDSGCTDGGLWDTDPKVTRVSTFDKMQDLENNRNWYVDYDNIYFDDFYIGFYLRDEYQPGQWHKYPIYANGVWSEAIPGGRRFKFTIFRTPWLDPINPGTASVDWELNLGINTLLGGTDHTYSGTETFAPGETSRLIQVDHLGAIPPHRSEVGLWDPYHYQYVELSNSVNENLGNRDTADGNYYDIYGISLWRVNYLMDFSNAATIKAFLYRVPFLNPDNPGVASVDWELRRRLVNYSNPSLSDPAWTVLETGTISFGPDDKQYELDLFYDGPFTPSTNYGTSFTSFAIFISNPVNEKLGVPVYFFSLYTP